MTAAQLPTSKRRRATLAILAAVVTIGIALSQDSLASTSVSAPAHPAATRRVVHRVSTRARTTTRCTPSKVGKRVTQAPCKVVKPKARKPVPHRPKPRHARSNGAPGRGLNLAATKPLTVTPPPAAPALPTAGAATASGVAAGVDARLNASFVTRSGTQLSLGGSPFHFTGVNMYQGMSDFPMNRTCGTTIYDLDAAFGALAPGSVVRVWAYQPQAINAQTGAVDWTAFDRFIDAANRHGIKLDMVLGDQAGVCDDGHFKDQAWYRGDYTKAFDDWPVGDYHQGEAPMSWWTWLHLVVPRYANNPTIAFWEPINEPETSDCGAGFTGQGCYGHGSCPDGNAELLRDWFTTVGTEIHRLAPRQLVASGTIGNGECGDWEQYYAMMASSPGVDVVTVHDYSPTGIPANMAEHIDQAAAADKPIFWEEVGTDAGPGGCASTSTRAQGFAGKIDQLSAQPAVAGFLAWNWIEQRGNGCDLEIDNADPLMTVIRAGWPSG